MATEAERNGVQTDGQMDVEEPAAASAAQLRAAAEQKIAELLAGAHAPTAGVVVGPATAADRNDVMALAAQREHWQYVDADVDLWLRLYGRDSFYLARNVNGKGGPLGYLSCVRQRCAGGDDLAVFGEFFVLEDERDRGVGTALWTAATDALADCANKVAAVLQSSPSKRKICERAGFAHEAEHPIHRLHVKLGGEQTNGQGTGEGPESLHARDVSADQLRIVDATQLEPEQTEALAAYDADVSKMDRAGWLAEWIRHPCGKSAVAFSEDGRVQGYGVIRASDACVGSAHLGPLYAESVEAAERLLRHLLHLCELTDGGELVMHATPGDGAPELVQRVGTIDRTVVYMHMFSQHPHQFDHQRVYALSDLVVNVV